MPLAFSIVFCAGIYVYHWIAQELINPMPVQGVLKESTCRPSAISNKGVQTQIPILLTIYEFPSRSKDAPVPGRGGRPHLDQITEYLSLETNAECLAAEKSREPGSKRTVWAGEDSLDNRFRARLTEHQELPSSTLLWVPGCIAALIFWLWRRFTR